MSIVDQAPAGKPRSRTKAPAAASAEGPREPSLEAVAAAEERRKPREQLCTGYPDCKGVDGGCKVCTVVADSPPVEATPGPASPITTRAELGRLHYAIGQVLDGFNGVPICCAPPYLARMQALLGPHGIELVTKDVLKARGHVLKDHARPVARVEITRGDIHPLYMLHAQTKPAPAPSSTEATT